MTEPIVDQMLGCRADTEIGAAAKLGALTQEPFEIEPGQLYAYRDNRGDLCILDTAQYAALPRRKQGRMRVTDAASFVKVAQKHAEPQAEYWARVESLNVFGILNAATESATGWGDNVVILDLKTTDEWDAWTSIDGKMFDQTGFAEFLEQWGLTVVTPDAATMLELAQSIRATTRVDFQSGKRLSNGEVQLQYVENTEAKGGHRGDLPIPERLTIALAPFHGADTYQVNAMFRYRITNGQLILGIVLERPNEVRRQAFDDQVQLIATDLGVDVWNGIPAIA